MDSSYDFVCEKCGCKTYVVAENEYQKVLLCENCAEGYVVEQKKPVPELNIPKCPTCGSTNIKKISGLSKVGSVAVWGLLSRKVHKQWHCNNCGSEW